MMSSEGSASLIERQVTGFANDPVSDRYRAVNALVHFERLLGLDDVWTQSLERLAGPTPADLGVLIQVAEDMQAELTHVRDDAEWLREVIGERGEDIDRVMFEALEVADIPNESKSLLWEFVGPDRHYAQTVADALTIIIASEPVSSVGIGHELNELLAERPPSGDLPQIMRCALLLAASLAAIIAGGFHHAIELASLILTAGCAGPFGPKSENALTYLDELERLAALYKDGMLTQDEFNAFKDRVRRRGDEATA
jgi:hypothetical protein